MNQDIIKKWYSTGLLDDANSDYEETLFAKNLETTCRYIINNRLSNLYGELAIEIIMKLNIHYRLLYWDINYCLDQLTEFYTAHNYTIEDITIDNSNIKEKFIESFTKLYIELTSYKQNTTPMMLNDLIAQLGYKNISLTTDPQFYWNGNEVTDKNDKTSKPKTVQTYNLSDKFRLCDFLLKYSDKHIVLYQPSSENLIDDLNKIRAFIDENGI
jgi:hypothetical protein